MSSFHKSSFFKASTRYVLMVANSPERFDLAKRCL